MERYTEYKDSGVEWIGDIPSHWGVAELKRLVQVIPSNVDKHIIEGELLVKLCNYTDVYYNEKISDDQDLTEGSCTERELERYSVLEGDVIITKDSESPDDIGIPALIEKTMPNVVCGYHLTMLRGNGINGRFLFRYIQSNLVRAYFEVNSSGVTRFSLGKSSIAEMKTLLPPVEEQERIVVFLDERTGWIDGAVKKTEKKIALLKEQRTSLINEVVTKGLDSKVEMKDSGVEWIGDIPSHWSVVKLQYLCNCSTGGRDTQDRIDNGEYPFFVRSPKIERIDTYSFDGEAVLTAGDGVGAGKVFHHFDGKFDFHQRVYKFSGFKNIIGRFFFLYMSTLFINVSENQNAKSTVDSLRKPMLDSFPFALPPMEEQERIVAFLDERTGMMDEVIAKEEERITLLKQYRQSLISEVVTGKRKVF